GGDGGTCSALGRAMRVPEADDYRKDGQKNHNQNYIVNFLSDVGDRAAEKIAAQNHRANPKRAAENIVEEIGGVGHPSSSSHGRAERANDRNEARQNHRLAAVLFIEIVRTL